jgi:hypothetical protein
MSKRARELPDLKGQVFSRLKVLEYNGSRPKIGRMWLCKCSCGKQVEVCSSDLKGKRIQSCGCLKLETACKNAPGEKHGQKRTKLYYIWSGMKERCNKESYWQYHTYGGRGIKVCEEWSKSFSVFRDWSLSNGYQEGLSIDRIDVNGNYEPSNCRWATMKEQCNNKRNNIVIEVEGVTKTLQGWVEATGISRSTLLRRYHCGERGQKFIRPVNSMISG